MPADPGARRPAEGGADPTAHAEAVPWWSTPRWHRVRTTASLALLVAAVVLLAMRGGTLGRAAGRIAHARPGWIVLAIASEGGSMVVFARLQQRLLRAGGAELGLGTMTAITTAANALTGTLPGGVGWAAAWIYDQLGTRRVARVVRVWAFFVAGGVSSFALFVIVAAGVEIAGGRGPVSSLRWLAFLLALIPLAALALEAVGDRPPVSWVLAWARRNAPARVPGARRAWRAVRGVVATFAEFRLGPRGWAAVLVLALCNWLLDCVVVVASLEALGVAVPWRGILVVYGLTQISASLPVTPGGIGVVAGSMTLLLHAYGVPMGGALAVVVLYRVLSFWILVPIGWAVWSVLELSSRARRVRARRAR